MFLFSTDDAQHVSFILLQINNQTNVKLHTANAIFANPNIPIEAQFINEVETNYLATTSNFDLAAVGGPEKAINDFVNNKTKGLIKDILPPGMERLLCLTVLPSCVSSLCTHNTNIVVIIIIMCLTERH